MQNRLTRRWPLVPALLGLLLVGQVPADNHSGTAGGDVELAELRPKWEIGDGWIVETATLLSQVDDAEKAKKMGKPVRWQFAVTAAEKVGGRHCHRVDIRSLSPGQPHPKTTVWVDRESMTLRQIQTQLRVQGEFRTVTESYDFVDGQPAAVIGPIAALPVDMPFFAPPQEKGTQTWVYQATMGPLGQKSLEQESFAFEVRQSVTRPSTEEVKGLLHEAFAKDLDSRPVVELKLETFDRRVRQLWQPGQPWPTYAANGTTVARLVESIPGS